MSFCRLPLEALLFASERFYVCSAFVGLVIIHDDLMGLVIPFSGCEHHSTRILQHGDDERNDEGLREKVLGGAEESGTLPIPVILLQSVVASVTLP